MSSYGEMERSVTDVDTTLVCEHCGSKNVITEAWVDVNTKEYDHSCDNDYDWCNNCQEETTPISRKKYEEQNKDE